MARHFRNEGHAMNKKGIGRLMRMMRNHQKPITSLTTKGHKTYPHLLHGLRAERPSQV